MEETFKIGLPKRAAERLRAPVVADEDETAAQMAAGGRQQASGVEQIAVAMQNINQATVQSLASTRQTEMVTAPEALIGSASRPACTAARSWPDEPARLDTRHTGPLVQEELPESSPRLAARVIKRGCRIGTEAEEMVRGRGARRRLAATEGERIHSLACLVSRANGISSTSLYADGKPYCVASIGRHSDRSMQQRHRPRTLENGSQNKEVSAACLP